MKALHVTRIIAGAAAGACIGDCMREAIQLAADEWRNVEFTYNGNIYVVRPNDLLASVSRNKPDAVLSTEAAVKYAETLDWEE